VATRIATTARNAACDALVDLVDAGSGAGTIDIRTGSQPATPETTATGTLLATFTLADPAFGSASTGVATLASTPRTTTGLAAGDAGWFRMKDSAGNAVLDGSVTATGGGGQITVNTVTVSVDLDLELTSGTVTLPAS
jgi:hypothetical protein